MSDPADNEDAAEAEAVGEKPDLGHKPDALRQSLSGTDSGSDTRAGSLDGGALSGSDADDESDVINKALAEKGRAGGDPKTPASAESNAVKNTGEDQAAAKATDADAASG